MEKKIWKFFGLFLKKLLTIVKKNSILILVKRKWSFSSAGRASALQAGGHRFEPYNDHHLFTAW